MFLFMFLFLFLFLFLFIFLFLFLFLFLLWVHRLAFARRFRRARHRRWEGGRCWVVTWLCEASGEMAVTVFSLSTPRHHRVAPHVRTTPTLRTFTTTPPRGCHSQPRDGNGPRARRGAAQAQFLSPGRGDLTVSATNVAPRMTDVAISSAGAAAKRAFEAQLVWG